MSDAASSDEGKTIAISKAQVEEAYQQVKRNKGAPGYDHQSLLHFEAQKEKELYKYLYYRREKEAWDWWSRHKNECW
jgi:4-alpha-glucanotransferase